MPLLRAFYCGQTFEYDTTTEHTGSIFGGPAPEKLLGDYPNSQFLHHVATLSGAHRPDYMGGFLRALPLLYGIRFDGCDLQYQVVAGMVQRPGYEVPYTGIEILALTPEVPADDWPYPEYPTYLPYYPMELRRKFPCSWTSFAESIFDYRVTDPDNLVIAMSPPTMLGHSLWGLDGDMEGVELVWEVDPATMVVDATTRCT